MLLPEDRVRLSHILDAAQKATALVAGKSLAELEADDTRVLALTRLIEIIGEAASKVDETTQQAIPQLPWRAMIGTRNRLIHGYFDVDVKILWQIAVHDVPKMISVIKQILRKD